MPLVIIVGLPCTGKSKFSQFLKESFLSQKKNVVVVSDEDYFLSHDRNFVYKNSSEEKKLRGYLKSAVQRSLLPNNLVIVDSSNYIKGFRYELYCLSKEHKTTHCLVQCICHKELAHERNEKRNSTTKYDTIVMSDLVKRYEDPVPSNRWDSPLFNLFDNQEEIFTEVNQVLFERIAPKPNKSTVSKPISDNNFLHTLDEVTKKVMNEILSCQKMGQLQNIKITDCRHTLNLKMQISTNEMLKKRRQYISFIKKYPVSTDSITDSFVQYLNSNINEN